MLLARISQVLMSQLGEKLTDEEETGVLKEADSSKRGI